MAVKQLISRLKEEFGHSPVVANVVFAFFMAVIEKILEVEFACPCHPSWNKSFAATFFLIPAATAFLLMMAIHRFNNQEDPHKCWYSLLTPIVWQAIIFLDGQYFVCAMTDWQGTFVSVERTYLKWCTPTNATTSSEELMARSRSYYIMSQVRKSFCAQSQILICYIGAFSLIWLLYNSDDELGSVFY